ncbi:MAG TPA: radical SAM protein [Candidatus Latescibacteria bacterium]|nr:radical SAM protein [Candidatus Latescibacterota bacterium]
MRPILCSYYITYRCNARCAFCGIWQDPTLQRSIEADPEDVVRNLKQARYLGVRFVDFTGGEPLLYEPLPKLLSHAKKMGLWTSVTTNCLLYPERAKDLSGLVDLLHFSLDSDRAEVHDRLRGVESFHRVLESIEIAKGLSECPDLLFTVTADNFEAMTKLAKFAREQRLILIINPTFSYFGNDPMPPEADRLIYEVSGYPYVYVNRALIRLIRSGGNNPRNPRCRAVTSTIVISPDNCLLLPCFHHRQRNLPIDGNLSEVWEGGIAQSERRMEGRHAFCKGCTINCYFDPSFLYKFDIYFTYSLLSKVKYAFDKYLRR